VGDETVIVVHTVVQDETALTVTDGEVAVAVDPGTNIGVEGSDGTTFTPGTLFLVKVERPGSTSSQTTVKLIDGSVRVRPRGTSITVPMQVSAPNPANPPQARLVAGREPMITQAGPLDPGEAKLVGQTRQAAATLLGKPLGNLPSPGR
jgi:hypothetical protein